MGNICHFLTPSQILNDIPSDFIEADKRIRRLLIEVVKYITEFLTKPNIVVGRVGAVCPFVAPALRCEAIKLTASAQTDLNQKTMMDDLAPILTLFASDTDQSCMSELEAYRSYVIVYPFLPETYAADLIQSVQKALKPSFVDRGLMIGEFFPNCRTPGLHNPAFHPLDTPFFSLAIRRMNPADAPFMLEDDRFISTYLRRFGQSGEKRIRSLIEKKCLSCRASGADFELDPCAHASS